MYNFTSTLEANLFNWIHKNKNIQVTFIDCKRLLIIEAVQIWETKTPMNLIVFYKLLEGLHLHCPICTDWNEWVEHADLGKTYVLINQVQYIRTAIKQNVSYPKWVVTFRDMILPLGFTVLLALWTSVIRYPNIILVSYKIKLWLVFMDVFTDVADNDSCSMFTFNFLKLPVYIFFNFPEGVIFNSFQRSLASRVENIM